MGRRSDIEIIAAIPTETKKVARKTRIMYNCNLSYKQLKLYINFLLEIGILDSYSDESSNRSYFKITSKGSKFLSAYSKLKALMS
jgi:predicted transcriptional regulator